MILWEARRFTEAEAAFRHSMTLGFGDVSQRWLAAMGLASTLDALGRTEEGVAVLEEALFHEDRRFLPSARWALEDIARLSRKIQRPVDVRWLKVAADVAVHEGVALPAGDTPGEVILSLLQLLHTRRAARDVDGDGSEDDPEEPLSPDTPPT
jgi:hypothetical protein